MIYTIYKKEKRGKPSGGKPSGGKPSVIFICFMASLLLSCSSVQTPIPEEIESEEVTKITLQEEQIQRMGIQTQIIERKEISKTLDVRGKIEVPPQNLIQISFPFEGTIKDIKVSDGSKVKPNQILIGIESLAFIDLQQSYLETFHQLNYLAIDLKRQEEIQSQNLGVIKNVQKIKSDYLSLEATFGGLKAKLKLLNLDLKKLEAGQILSIYPLKSSVDGFVSQINVNTGSFVQAGQSIIQVISLEHIHAEFYIYEKDISLVHIGQKIRIYTENYAKGLLASVYLINLEVLADKTIKIHGHFSEEDEEKLLVGTYLQAKIYLDPKEVDVVPNDAILDFEGKNYIFSAQTEKDKEITYQMIPVKVGETQDSDTQIIFSPELEIPAFVVNKGAYTLLSMLKNMEEED